MVLLMAAARNQRLFNCRRPVERGLSVALASSAFLAVLPSASSDASRAAGISPAVGAALLKQARQVAREDGDSRPYDVEAVLTTREKATRLQQGTRTPTCEQSPSCADKPVYMVAMQGRFTCNTCSIPFHAKVPRGTVVTLEIEAATMFRSGFSLTTRYPNLKAVGAVVHLAK